jgi:ribosomal protein S18 acetylase RimI-like enzyme
LCNLFCFDFGIVMKEQQQNGNVTEEKRLFNIFRTKKNSKLFPHMRIPMVREAYNSGQLIHDHYNAAVLFRIMQRPRKTSIGKKGDIIITQLAVKDEFQRQGLGTKLFRKVEDRGHKLNATESGPRFIHLKVLSDNNPAIQFYKKMGMQESGTREMHSKKYGTQELTVMSKKIE